MSAVAPRLVLVEQVAEDVEIELRAATAHRVAFERRIAATPAGIPEAAADAEGMLVRFHEVSAETMDALPSLRVIGRGGVGVDNIDVAAASRRGIAVVNVPDYCVEEVATHAAALVLSANRRLAPAAAQVAAGEWARWLELDPPAPLSQQTLGVVGLGRIGRATAELMAPMMGCVVTYDPFAQDAPAGASRVGLDELFERSDVVTLHCPLTEETRHLIDAGRIARMKRGAVLVNVSRGGLVDDAAVAAALSDGTLGYAALDVLGQEPPPAGHPLVGHPRALVTNHIAWLSTASLDRNRELLADRCAAYLAGEPVETVVNRDELQLAAGTTSD
jgi:D-3-phosphoglycerate dehydrogenase